MTTYEDVKKYKPAYRFSKWTDCGQMILDEDGMREFIANAPLMAKCEYIGLPEDVARFICEWLSEYEPAIDDRIRYGTYDWMRIGVYTEEELMRDVLEWHNVTEEEYSENYGSIWRDASFDGVLVIGE